MRTVANTLTPDLMTTLSMVADLARDNRDDWWVIAGAAAALHGATDIIVGDVDVVMSARDAESVLAACAVVPMRGAGNALFRSRVFAQWCQPPMTVEIMADFDYFSARSWHRVALSTRTMIGLGSFSVFVPDRAELTAMFRAFGRPKDVERARLLEML